MDRMGQDTEDGFQAGVFSSQGMVSGKGITGMPCIRSGADGLYGEGDYGRRAGNGYQDGIGSGETSGYRYYNYIDSGNVGSGFGNLEEGSRNGSADYANGGMYGAGSLHMTERRGVYGAGRWNGMEQEGRQRGGSCNDIGWDNGYHQDFYSNAGYDNCGMESCRFYDNNGYAGCAGDAYSGAGYPCQGRGNEAAGCCEGFSNRQGVSCANVSPGRFWGREGWQETKQADRLLLLLLAVIGMGMAFFGFLATLFFIFCILMQKPLAVEKGENDAVYESVGNVLPSGQEEAAPGKEFGIAGVEEEPDAVEGADGEYYGEIRDAVRTDLSYSVEWQNYEYEGNSDTVLIEVDYPVIGGDVPNVDLLNDVIAGEVDYFEEYYAEYSKYMLEDEVFAVYSEGFVTYMDEDVMSVVFVENIYTDYWVDCGLYCVNIDMENGVVLDNGSILDVDDEFAIDFRTRSRKQNGDVSALEYLTDQEVVYYLTGGSTGIVFFTPLGMEIGLNYGEDYVTVTYKDYKDFLLKS